MTVIVMVGGKFLLGRACLRRVDSAAAKLVHLHGLTVPSLQESDAVRQLHRPRWGLRPGIRGPDRGIRKVKAFLFPSEADALLSCADVPLELRRACALATYLGLRAGELRSLTWKDIDLAHGTIHVRRGFDRDKHQAESTKSKRARRFTYEAALRPLLAVMQKTASGKGAVLQAAWFFTSSHDLREHLRTADVTRADLFVTDETRKNLTFHDLRATTLTWMAVRGDDPVKIKARAGHGDLATTESYVRTAGDIETVFGTLPATLLGADADIRLFPIRSRGP